MKIRFVGAALALGIVAATGMASASATAATPAQAFAIKTLSPNPIRAVTNGPRKTLKITWSGTPTFPVTAYSEPTPKCSHAGVTCASEQMIFTKNAATLVWKQYGWCTGSVPNGWKGKWHDYLVDAKGRKTASVTATLICEL